MEKVGVRNCGRFETQEDTGKHLAELQNRLELFNLHVFEREQACSLLKL